jgi:antitoxin YefM
MVTQTTYSKARQSFCALWDQVISTREPVFIKRRGSENVALISADELSSVMETVHLLRSPENARRLLAALNRAYEGDIQPSSLEELKQELVIE